MLAPPFVGFEGPVQIAYAVADVRASAERWIELGIGPFFVRDHIPLDNVRIDGEPGRFDHSSAFAQWGDVMVELICDHGSPAAEPTARDEGASVHHVAFFVDDFEAATASLTTAGLTEAMFAEAGGMPFAFHDARSELGHLIEIYEPVPRLAAFYADVRAASESWDGSEPLRY